MQRTHVVAIHYRPVSAYDFGLINPGPVLPSPFAHGTSQEPNGLVCTSENELARHHIIPILCLKSQLFTAMNR